MKNNKTNSTKKPTAPKPQELLVEKDSGLLDFLLEKLTKLSRNNVKSLLKNKAVTINGKKISQFDFPLSAGQRVIIAAQGNDYGQEETTNPLLKIIYEDEELIAINKPAGLLSIASDKEQELTAYRFVTEYVKKSSPTNSNSNSNSNSSNRIFIVHRLDRDTSGVLLFAKTDEMKLLLQDNWETAVKERGYTAVVEGVPDKNEDRLISWLLETKTRLVYSSGKTGDGKEAITRYIKIAGNDEYSLLDVRLETGRKNQIRVQLHDIGHPVAGDKKYGAAANPIKRLALHAHLLEVTHPKTGELLTLSAPIPKEFIRLTAAATRTKN